jgi:hypothetical protein
MQVKQINTPLHTPLVTLLMHFVPGHSCCYNSLHALSFFAALWGLLLLMLHASWSHAVQVSRRAAAAAICTLAIFVRSCHHLVSSY